MVMSVRVSVRPSIRVFVRPSARFPHFSPTFFDILSWNFAHDFVLMYYRSSSTVVTLRRFLKELCLFVNLEYMKCAVFRTFLLHALTYWAEILHVTLFHRTTDQVRVSSICVNVCGSYAPFGTYNTGNTQFSAFFSCMLDILSWNFAYDVVLSYYRSSLSVIDLRQCLWELCPFWNLEYWIYSFPHFSLACFDILSLNFAYDFVSPYYRSSSSVVNLHQFFKSNAPFGT